MSESGPFMYEAQNSEVLADIPRKTVPYRGQDITIYDTNNFWGYAQSVMAPLKNRDVVRYAAKEMGLEEALQSVQQHNPELFEHAKFVMEQYRAISQAENDAAANELSQKWHEAYRGTSEKQVLSSALFVEVVSYLPSHVAPVDITT